MDGTVGADRPLVAWNMELDTLRADLGAGVVRGWCEVVVRVVRGGGAGVGGGHGAGLAVAEGRRLCVARTRGAVSQQGSQVQC